MEILKHDWQKQGGSLEIPDGWFVDEANFDISEPYIHIQPEHDHPDFENYPAGKVIDVPKSLAYYLSIHFGGSRAMHDMLVNSGKTQIRNAIKEILEIV